MMKVYLPNHKHSKAVHYRTYIEACSALAELKSQLMAKGEASDLFGRERDNGLSAILGNLDQSVFG